MKKIILILIFLILIPLAIAQENDFNAYNKLDLNFKLESTFEMVETGDEAKIEDIKAYLTFFPQDDNMQKVTSNSYYGNPKPSDITQSTQEVTYIWDNPEIRNYKFGVESTLSMTNSITIVDEKVQFPIETNSLPYINPTEYIDITQEIKSQAQQLAEGEDDLYVVTIKIAEWVESNIKYDLNSLTADVVQKSSWVLKNKEGVCDELTNLFISMMRSLGVPARFVSGMAYTNMGNKWGPHGWAEVYFPGKGWVPFDVTYRQYGWIDPSHVKLKVSEDSGDAAIRYTWKSHNTKIESKEIELTTNLIEKGDTVSPIKFELKPLKNNVGPGSYVPVQVEITNPNNYYFPVLFTVTKATELTERNTKAVVLKPHEKTKIFWITRLPVDTNPNFIYKSTIEVEDNFHTTKSIEVVYASNLEITTLEEAKAMMESSQKVESKAISKKLALDCKGPRYSFVYEPTDINCRVQNKGNTNMGNVKVCYEKDCEVIALGINEQMDINFKLNLERGVHNIDFTASHYGTRSSDIVSVNILDTPNLKIASTSYPEEVDYNQDFNITLSLIVEVPVKDVKIRINNRNVISLPELDISKTAIIMTKGKEFLNTNEIKVEIEFKDANNKVYNLKSGYPIRVTRVPWYVKILNLLDLI